MAKKLIHGLYDDDDVMLSGVKHLKENQVNISLIIIVRDDLSAIESLPEKLTKQEIPVRRVVFALASS